MKKVLCSAAVLAVALSSVPANANLLTNGSLDVTTPQEIVPGFFLPWPADWVGEGSRTIGGPYNDFMSSEPWAGPAPTPVTTGGATGNDWAVFFKPFSGSVAQGAATGNLYQDQLATPGQTFTLSGWAGAEANAQMQGAVFALDFLDVNGTTLSSASIDLLAAGLLTPNGQPFNYKQYSVTATAPAGAAIVRSRASMLGAMSNPAGGGQAFVVDDFNLVVPEPTSAVAILAAGTLVRRRRA